MSVIKILQDNVTNKIAAGEVIARPASVVKELVENSIDSGALKIQINIEQAGIKLISVTDNGSGMDADDALLCLEAHATSKIAKIEDVNSILSFGFRGEALPSIASVSRFTLRTRQHDALEGNEVFVQGDKLISSKPVGCAPGTEIVVRDLFFNTPARRKFLKSVPTEEKHIIEAVYSLALPYPSISFELICDGRPILNSPNHNDLTPRISTLFGNSFKNQIIPVDFTENGIKISGFIAKHGFTKNSRKEQRIFINGRAADAFAVYSGIRDGYGTLITKGRYPPVIIFLRMDPNLVDVNVHPAKKEVRFRQERLVSNAIANAIRTTLQQASSPSTSTPVEISLDSILQGAEISYNLKPAIPELPQMPQVPQQEFNHVTGSEPAPPQPSTNSTTERTVAVSNNETISPSNLAKDGIQFPGSGPIEILGFLSETYILAKAQTGLIIIDQHAAHERVLYEKLLKNSEKEDVASQKLLLPITIDLSSSDKLLIEKNLDIFNRLGFEIEPFGQNTVLIHSIPTVFPQDNIGGFISDLLSELIDTDHLSPKINLNAVAQAACKTAVKAHDLLDKQEIMALLKQMSECELPFSCPHGRPTIINISLKELEKRFGRK